MSTVGVRINDFVIRLANINGTGSASANSMLAKSIFRSGVPIGPKNMFPSNIQGLPTWYEIRVSEHNFTGRRGGVDLCVAMNPQTFTQDVASVDPGGYLVFDSTKPLSPRERREDIHYLGLPLTELVRDAYPNPKVGPILKNVVYVGAIAAMLGIDVAILEQLIAEQFAKKPKLIPDNVRALRIGFDYVGSSQDLVPVNLRIVKRDLVEGKILLTGNDAAGLGCVYAGATVAGWYPITPSTSLVDAFSRFCQRLRVDEDGRKKFAILQAEDELSAIGMVLGATWNGARAFTATSGPGVSLMSEFLGFAYYAEVPVVLFNIQRCGPSTGMPTRTQQSDLLLCAYASHGDTKHILLFPANPKECFEFAIAAFDLADRYQTPVIVMSDLELGMNEFVVDELTWDVKFRHDRGKVLNYEHLARRTEPFYRYLDNDQDGVPYRTLPGVHAKGAYFTRGSGHDRFGRYTEDGDLYQENMRRLQKKFETASTQLPSPILTKRSEQSRVLVIYCGTTAEPLNEALEGLQQLGHSCDDVRVRAFPFTPELKQILDAYPKVVVVEQNRDAQLRSLLMIELNYDPARLNALTAWDGMPATAKQLTEDLLLYFEERK